jgi:ABC-type uncharacterized transport system substrate-binding protein
MTRPTTWLAATLLGVATALAAAPASAHPHVWVTAETTIVFEKGSVGALRHKWTFDDMYTAMAIQGLDTNKDGVYDRQELAELAQVNIDGLKEFEYFTFIKLGDKRLKTKAPLDYYLEHTKEGLLSLYFTTPLAQPVLPEAKGFSFQITDPGFFIAFEFAKTDPIKLGPGAPANCKPRLAAAERDAAEAQKLGESFFQQMSGAGFGIAVARAASIECTP